jgi:hypothetical protein
MRNFALIVAFALLFSAHGCAKPQSDATTPHPYEVVSALYSEHTVGNLGCDIDIPYPQIVGLADAALQERINAKLLTVFLGIYMSSWQWDGFNTITCEYEIKRQDGELFSVLNDSEVYIAGTASPARFMFAVNIDMQSGEILPLEKLFDVEETIDSLARGEFETAYSVNELMGFITFDELAEWYKQGVSDFDYGHQYGYYIAGDKLGIIVSLPHGLGDVAVFER